MSKMVIYDPAMCCSTGVCGPSVNPELLRVAAVIENLKKAGIEVQRHNLSYEPQAFMSSEAVNNALNKSGAVKSLKPAVIPQMRSFPSGWVPP
jgi:hypothetical protein